MEAEGTESVVGSGAQIEWVKDVCGTDEVCDVATAVSEDEMYGGIQQECVIKGCNVTIYNKGPVKIVNVKTDQPCDVPLLKGH